ncbi:MAG: hypothetical protein FJ319_14370 [SAR202 cluster bacterium]|nr:hypothetical protein [SAR202 cluster bacterium]
MPKFEVVSLHEAESRTSTGKRAETARQYLGYVNGLRDGIAGRLRPDSNETFVAVRRRLGAAAKASGREIVIRRNGNDVYFWSRASETAPKRGRGRPRKTVA